MSISAVVVEGVRRAATYAAMLFTLNAAEPAAAQPPAAQARPAAALAIDGSVAASGLTLAAHHVDARIAGDIASVQVWLLLRNDTAAEVSAQHLATILDGLGFGTGSWPACISDRHPSDWEPLAQRKGTSASGDGQRA